MHDPVPCRLCHHQKGLITSHSTICIYGCCCVCGCVLLLRVPDVAGGCVDDPGRCRVRVRLACAACAPGPGSVGAAAATPRGAAVSDRLAGWQAGWLAGWLRRCLGGKGVEQQGVCGMLRPVVGVCGSGWELIWCYVSPCTAMPKLVCCLCCLPLLTDPPHLYPAAVQQ